MEKPLNPIYDSTHRDKIDRLIIENTDPSIIRDLLVIDGIDCFTYEEIRSYVDDYLKTILRDTGIQHQHLKRELSSSYALALSKSLGANDVTINCAVMLELDILRIEKLTQQVMANQRLNVDLRSLERLIKMKNGLIKNRLIIEQYEMNKLKDYNPGDISADPVHQTKLDDWMGSLEPDKAEIVLQALEIMSEDAKKNEITI